MATILGLDVSTKTGWSLCESDSSGCRLVSYGLLQSIGRPKDMAYPEDYLQWALENARLIINKIEETKPDIIVIEETTKSQNSFSQKILEWTHLYVATCLVEKKLSVKYFMTGEWRVLVEAKMTKEEKKKNALVRKLKAASGSVVAKDETGKRIGITGKKHVNVRRANEIFGLSLKQKDNDIADALLLNQAFWEFTYNKKPTANE